MTTDGGLFKEWFATQMAKQPNPRLPERIRTMHRMYGVSWGHTCKHCRHCVLMQHHDRHYYKCELSRITHGPGTDWRCGWPACGRYEEQEEAAGTPER